MLLWLNEINSLHGATFVRCSEVDQSLSCQDEVLAEWPGWQYQIDVLSTHWFSFSLRPK